MKIILTEDVKGTGKKGEVLNVSEGYARNFLFPKNMAVEANEKNLGEIEKQKAEYNKKKAAELEEARLLKHQLDKVVLPLTVKAGEGGRLFGAITAKDIADALQENKGISVDKRKIELKAPIKNLGEHSVAIKLHQEVTAVMQVIISAGE